MARRRSDPVGRTPRLGTSAPPSRRSPRPNQRIVSVRTKEAAARSAHGTGRTPVRWNRAVVRLRSLGKPVAILALLGVVVYGGVLAHGFVVESPHFQVKRVHVTPTVHVTSEEVRRLAGIGPTTNIFSVSLGEVVRQVESHPWIARAVVRRRLPDAIHIQVTENVAAGAVLLKGEEPEKSSFYLISSEGAVFKRARLAELEDLPLITGLTRQEYRSSREESRLKLREALAVVRHYEARAGRPKLGEVHVDPVEGVTLYTASQAVQIRLGRGEYLPKLRRMDRILAALAARGQSALAIRLDNARHPRRVTVQLAEAGSSGANAAL